MSDTAIQTHSDFLPIERAARIVAPISTHDNGPFEGGVFRILKMLGEFDIAVDAGDAPPPPPYEISASPLTKEWFSAIQHFRSGADYHKVADWNRSFVDWVKASLKVSHTGILANLSSPLGQWHAPVENVDTAGASWSFPQVMAWIATREPIEVARIQYSQHFGSPMDDDPPGVRAMAQSDHDRRILIGWLVLRTSLDHCTCGSVTSAERAAWETCQCVGRAYDALRAFAKGTKHPMPEYQPKPAYGSFTLTWPDGAHELRFPRAEVLEHWARNGDLGGSVPPNRKLNHAEIISSANAMLLENRGISKGSAAASIVADLPHNPKSGRPRDTRHIERIIGHLWEGGLLQSPR